MASFATVKLDRSTLVRLGSASNITLKLVTLVVSKLERSKETIFLQSKNIHSILVTLEVSSLSKPLIVLRFVSLKKSISADPMMAMGALISISAMSVPETLSMLLPMLISLLSELFMV